MSTSHNMSILGQTSPTFNIRNADSQVLSVDINKKNPIDLILWWEKSLQISNHNCETTSNVFSENVYNDFWMIKSRVDLNSLNHLN